MTSSFSPTETPSHTFNLATLMALIPLDRVQINSRHEISEARAFARYCNTFQELPYFYFQRLVGELMEVRSPGGYCTMVSPLDVCDVIHGAPITVQAMPDAVFRQRLGLTPLQRNASPPGPECFFPAYVLYAEKDRFGFSTPVVWFVDDSFNGGRPTRGCLTDAGRRDFSHLANRRIMPVMSRTAANHSADGGTEKSAAYARRATSLFIAAGIGGRTSDATALAGAGLTHHSLATLNTRFSGARTPPTFSRPDHRRLTTSKEKAIHHGISQQGDTGW